jgi:hypothetical protein
MLDLRKTLMFVKNVFEQNSISYALIGGFALSVYNEHRTTYDIDFLVDGAQKELIKTKLVSESFKILFETDEVIQFRSDYGSVDILFANRPLSLEMLTDSNSNNDLNVQIVSREALIGLKIQAYKNDSSREFQDKADIQRLINQEDINIDQVKKYADVFSAWIEIDSLRKKS